jgi:hypothetical protein
MVPAVTLEERAEALQESRESIVCLERLGLVPARFAVAAGGRDD